MMRRWTCGSFPTSRSQTVRDTSSGSPSPCCPTCGGVSYRELSWQDSSASRLAETVQS
jgi:hypothetical protein